jgi:hypothetical protein
MDTGSLPWVKRPGCGVYHASPSSAEVDERVELYLYFPSGPSWPVLGQTLVTHFCLRLSRHQGHSAAGRIKLVAQCLGIANVCLFRAWNASNSHGSENHRHRNLKRIIKITEDYSWFQIFAVFWMLNSFFWAIPVIWILCADVSK